MVFNYIIKIKILIIAIAGHFIRDDIIIKSTFGIKQDNVH